MATEATVNERLAAVTAAGTSVWLDQIRRSMTQGGELERLVREESLRGETSNPAIFEKAILGAEDYDEQIERMAHEGADARAIYQAIAIQDVQDAADVLRVVYDDTDGYDGYVSLEVDPDIAFDTDTHDGAGARVLGPRRPAQPDDQDPRHGRGPARHRADDLRGHEHQRHAAVQGRAVREGHRGLHPRARAPRRGGQVGRRALGRVVLRLARRHRGRQAPRGDAATRAARARPAWPTPAPPTSCSRAIFHGERFEKLRDAGAPRAAPAVGVDGREEPQVPRHDVRRRAGRAGDRQHDADGHAAGGRATTPRSAAPTADERPERRPPGAGRRRHRHDGRHRQAARGRRRRVRRRRWRSCSTGIESKREAIVTGRPATIEARHARRRSSRRSPRGCARRGRGRRRATASGRRTTRSGARPARPRSPTASAG